MNRRSSAPGGRILVITDPPPAGSTPAFRAAWLKRQRANATGRCECGATIQMPNRAARRAARARREPARALMLHEPGCIVSDPSMRDLYRAGWN